MTIIDFLPTIGVVAGALAAVGGGWINAWAAGRNEARRAQVEQKRDDMRLAREDAALAEASEREQTARAILQYREVAELFLGELSTIRTWVPMSDPRDQDGFQRWWQNQWSTQGEVRLLRSASNIEDDGRRNTLATVIQAVTYFDVMGDYFFRLYTWQAESALRVGFDLASAWARGQEPDKQLEKRMKDLSGDLNDLYEKWQLDDEVRREIATKQKPGAKRTKPST